MRLAHPFRTLPIALCCLASSACSDGSTGKSGQNVSSSLSCDVAPADELGTALERPGLNEPNEETNYGVVTCSYATGDNEHAVILRMLETDADGFEADKQSFEDLGLTTVDIDNLGEKAFSVSDATGAIVSNTVIAWDGTVEVELTTTGSSVDALQSMVAKILTRLP